MKRKVIQIGDSTQLVSLPRKWALKYNIKKGEELDIEEHGSKLIVSTSGEQVTKSGTIDLSKMSTLRLRTLCAAYLSGYDELEIQYASPDYIQRIQKVMQEFSGYDIVKQGKTSCTIRQISKPTAEEFDAISNRLFLLLHEMGSSIYEAIEKDDREMLESIKFREISINKFTNFCRRILNKIGLESNASTTAMYVVLTYLEQYGDELKLFAERLSELSSIDASHKRIFRNINVLFGNVYRVYKTKSLKLAVENALEHDKVEAEIQKLMKSKRKIDLEMYHHLKQLRHLVIVVQEAMLPLVI